MRTCLLTASLVGSVTTLTALAIDDHRISEASPLMLDFERGDDLSADAVADVLWSLGNRALEIADERFGIGCQILESTLIRLPRSHAAIAAFKVMTADGAIEGLSIDAEGTEIDEETIEAEMEQAAIEAGPIHETLAAALASAGPNELLPILVWFAAERSAGERPDPKEELTRADLEALSAARAEIRAAKVEAAVREFKLRAGEAGLGAFRQVAPGSPLLSASLRPPEILELAKVEGVLSVSLDDLQAVPDGNIARQVVKAHVVNNRGFHGQGVGVGVIEVGGRILAPDHPWLEFEHLDLQYTFPADGHAEAVAGVVASWHPSAAGIARQARLWIGGGGTFNQLLSKNAAASNWGAAVLNNSWSSSASSATPDATARFFDALSFDSWRTVVLSAGNQGSGPPRNPSNSYSSIVVGASFDRNTLTTADDVMATFSAWKDPSSLHGDREKPHVVAPGELIRVLDDEAPWLRNPGGNGTSFSAPAVAATAALLIDRRTILYSWPEILRAILMATALNNIEGATRLSEKDGAGQIRADLADDVARGRTRTGWNGMSYPCSSPSTIEFPMSLAAAKRTRVCISWTSDADYPQYTSRPGADLDLQILAPNGQVIATSSSWDNTFELVDFQTAAAGTYKLRIKKYRCQAATYLGWAWWQAP